MTLRDFIYTAVDFIYSILFPPFCLNCGRAGSYICDQCQLFLIEAEPSCPACGQPSPGGWRHSTCSSSIDRRIIVWEDEGLGRRLVSKILQSRSTHLLDDLMMRAVLTLFKNNDYVDFWLILRQGLVKILPNPSSRETRDHCQISERMAQKIVALNPIRDFKSTSETRVAVLVGLEEKVSIEEQARLLKAEGFDQVFSFTLIGRTC